MEQVALGGGVNRDLLRIDQEIVLDGGKKAPEMSSTLWVDENGQILKTFTDSSGGMVTSIAQDHLLGKAVFVAHYGRPK